MFISIIDDAVLEGDQVFTLSLSTSDVWVMLGTTETSIVITDNDGTKITNQEAGI